MFAHALPGPSGERLSRLIYEESEAIDRVGAGIRKALPRLAALEDSARTEAIDPALRLGEDLAVVVEKLRGIRKQGLSINDYLQQANFLPELTPVQEQLLVQLDGQRRSGRKVAEFLDAYTDLALNTPPPAQAKLPGAPDQVSRDTLLHQAVAGMGGAWVDTSQWTRTQSAISGFGEIPATEIEKLDPTGQKLGALVADNVSAAPQKPKPKRRGGNNWQQKWQVPAGKGGKSWTVAVDEKGRWGCSCPAWIYQRKPADAGPDWWREPCQHIKQVANDE